MAGAGPGRGGAMSAGRAVPAGGVGAAGPRTGTTRLPPGGRRLASRRCRLPLVRAAAWGQAAVAAAWPCQAAATAATGYAGAGRRPRPRGRPVPTGLGAGVAATPRAVQPGCTAGTAAPRPWPARATRRALARGATTCGAGPQPRVPEALLGVGRAGHAMPGPARARGGAGVPARSGSSPSPHAAGTPMPAWPCHARCQARHRRHARVAHPCRGGAVRRPARTAGHGPRP